MPRLNAFGSGPFLQTRKAERVREPKNAGNKARLPQPRVIEGTRRRIFLSTNERGERRYCASWFVDVGCVDERPRPPFPGVTIPKFAGGTSPVRGETGALIASLVLRGQLTLHYQHGSRRINSSYCSVDDCCLESQMLLPVVLNQDHMATTLRYCSSAGGPPHVHLPPVHRTAPNTSRQSRKAGQPAHGVSTVVQLKWEACTGPAVAKLTGRSLGLCVE